jgi:transcriptional regulator with XRE-family HTH domain
VIVKSPNQAVALRIRELLSRQGISQYRLEQKSGISRSQMDFILKDRNKSVSFTTVLMLARGFEMPLVEFLSSPHFENIDFD